jgi:guanine deaminase
MDVTALMRLAIEKTREGIAAGQSPFGCAIALNDQVIAIEHNRVLATTDITAHAEIVALRTACRAAGNVHLNGAIVVATCEPCPMCMSALHWARVDTVYYGATITDATGGGFNELPIAATEIVRLGGSPVKVVPGLLADECAALFTEWQNAGGRSY